MSVSGAARNRPDYRFQRQHRLLKPAAFTRVFREGFRSADQFFTLLAARNQESEPRLGMAVSRKVSNRAVVRNRIKRQAREAFRLQRAGLPDIDIVMMARRAAASASNGELRESLERHWQRLTDKCNDS